MTMPMLVRAPHRGSIALLWSLTLLSLIPFGSLPLVMLGAAANLAANGIAVWLLCSRSTTDRWNGAARLALQVAILVAGVIVFVRSGVSVHGLYNYVMHREL